MQDAASAIEDTSTITIDTQGTLYNLQEVFAAGGPVMPVLLTLSIIALTVILIKLFQFMRIRLFLQHKSGAAVASWLANNKQAAMTSLSASSHPVDITCLTTMVGLTRSNINLDSLREEVARIGNRQINSLKSGLWSLELISTVSPLIGLLGTVLGMINAFKALQLAGSQVDPSILSGGIWQALLTTAAGLAVAIPAVMVFKWLERKVNQTTEDMEDIVTRLFTSSIPGIEKWLAKNNANPRASYSKMSYSNA